MTDSSRIVSGVMWWPCQECFLIVKVIPWSCLLWPLANILRLNQSFIPHPATLPARQLSKRSHISGLPVFYDAPNESSGAFAKVSYCRVWCESFQSFLSGFPCPDAGSAHTHVLACMNAQRVSSHAPVCPFNGPAVSKMNGILHTHSLFYPHTTFILRTDLFL